MIADFLLIIAGGLLLFSAAAGIFYLFRRWFFGEGDKPRL